MSKKSQRKQQRAQSRATRTYLVGVLAWVLGGVAVWWYASPHVTGLIVAEQSTIGAWPWLLGWTGLCSVVTLTTARILYDREQDRRD